MNRLIDNLDWADIAHKLDTESFAVLPNLLDDGELDLLAAQLRAPDARDLLEQLDALKLGKGERRRRAANFPAPIANWPAAFYEHLAPIAKRWHATLNNANINADNVAVATAVPAQDDEIHRSASSAAQSAKLLVNHLHEGDFHALHHDADADHSFPIQLILLLSDPSTDFTGGEFVMVEQRPRMQSRPMVLPLAKGSIALISARHRPVQGANGHYRVSTRHAISRVHSGVRVCVELLFDF